MRVKRGSFAVSRMVKKSFCTPRMRLATGCASATVRISILADQALRRVYFQEKSVSLSMSRIAIVTERMTGPMKIPTMPNASTPPSNEKKTSNV